MPAFADDPTPPPKPLIEQRGLTMSAQEAMERITFHPFVPQGYTAVGLMPAFHGDDKDHPENRGIGYQYASAGQTYLLREWPLAGGNIDRYPMLNPEGTCKTGPLHPRTAERRPRASVDDVDVGL